MDQEINTLLSWPQPPEMKRWYWLLSKVQLMLLLLGEKQAVPLELDSSYAVAIGSLKHILTASGLYYIQRTRIRDGKKRNQFFAAKSKTDAKSLMEAFDRQYGRRNVEAEEVFGKMSGFPPTAITAYVKREAVKPAELPPEVRQSPAFVFGKFMLSKSQWEQELETGERWSKLIQNLDSKLYADYLQEFRLP